ncbi:MAG: hypothetical protein Q9175_003939 [Cornicularia normoerica]
MKSSMALSLLLLLPSIRAAALPQLVGDELESTSSSQKRDAPGNLAPRSSQPGSSELEYKGSIQEALPEAVASTTDDPSLDPSNLNRDLSSRSPQGPASNPGEFIDVGLSRVNPANHHSSTDSSSSSTDNGQEMDAVTDGSKWSHSSHFGGHSSMSHDRPPGEDHIAGPDPKMENDHHHNGSHHHKWSGTDHEHRKDGILAEFNAHGEHIVVYNGTHYPNGTSYNPANETMDGGQVLEKVVVDGDEVVVYREPWDRHHHHHHNQSRGHMPTATGVWLPSGTGWIPSGTGRPRHHGKVPSAAYAGFRGPMSKRGGRFGKDKYSAGRVKYGK